jgi:hypothetical protein
MMKTSWLLSAAAAWNGALGVGALFFPQELLVHGGVEARTMAVLVVQAAGSLYLGFAMLDWVARGNLIGGIYSRPVAVANFTHFAIGAITLVKLVAAGSAAPMLVVFAAVYLLFAFAFGKVLLTHPAPKSSTPGG